MRKLIITESERSEILKMHKNAVLAENKNLKEQAQFTPETNPCRDGKCPEYNETPIATELARQQAAAGKPLYDWDLTFIGLGGDGRVYRRKYALPFNQNQFDTLWDKVNHKVNDPSWAKYFEPSDHNMALSGDYKLLGVSQYSGQKGTLATPENDVIDGGTLPEFEVVANKPIVCAKSEQDLANKLYLRKGCKNDFVKQLQSLLDVKGYGTTLGKASIDGVFGDATKNAVMKFQKENNLKVDGVVGMQTWRALSALESVKTITPTAQQSAPVAQQPIAPQPATPQPATPEEPQTGRERRRERQDLRRQSRRNMQDLRARQRAQR